MRPILLLLFLGLGVPLQAQDLGSLIYKATSDDAIGPGGESRVYNRSYAVVIGISDYQNLPDLPGAVPDARHVAEALQKEHKFDVRLLLNQDATRTRITAELGDRLIPVLKYGDRVLIYFAGHGVTVGNGDAAMGYLMPVEGDNERRMATGIAMSELQRIFALYPSKHVMFVADACYSGLALSTRSVGLPTTLEDYLRQVTQKKVRLALTAGRADQEAHEWRGQGLFTYFFVEALKGNGDSNGDGILTSSELYAYIEPSVAQTALSNWQARQNPQLGRSGEGEFIFIVPGRDQPPAPVVEPAKPSPDISETAEITFWKSIENSAHPEDFQLFLKRFPSGIFSDLARLRLERLDSRRDSAPANPPTEAVVKNAPPAQPSPADQTESPVKPASDQVTRVVGRPSSPEEASAWEAVEQAEGIDNQKTASEAFIEKFPDGGMAPYAHYLLASIYRRNNDVANFVTQSEQVLKAIPVFPELSGYLALVYSESGRDTEAEQKALETLNGVDKIGRRTGETKAEWTLRRDQIASDASYALGRVYLGRAVQAQGENARQLLTQSIHRLEQALEYSPHHQYASFRLGEALLKAGKGKEALNWFARTAALGGDLGAIGGKRLAEVGKQLGFNEAELQNLTLEQRREVQQALNQDASNLDKPEKKAAPPSLFRNRPDEKRPD